MSATPDTKRQNGQYFTLRNPFSHPAFAAWAARAGLPAATVIEPFAGANNIIRMLNEMKLCTAFRAFDIEPAHADVEQRDVFACYPGVAGVVVTNPPYIAKNSAKRRGLPYPATDYADLYLFSLDLMLKNTGYVAAIIPAAFGTLSLFRDRLTHIIALPFSDMFGDTDHPVCLALFEPQTNGAVAWSWTEELGPEKLIRSEIPQLPRQVKVRFNDPDGILGLMAVDGTIGPSIAFCRGEKIPAEEIKHSSRSISRLTVEGVDEANLDQVIEIANAQLARIRKITRDVTLTPFKGLRKDGDFRRRLDFKTAKIVLSLAMQCIAERNGGDAT